MKPIISSGLYLVVLYSLSAFVFDPAKLYHELWWLDIPMHILGGFGVASFALSIARYKKHKLSLASVFFVYLVVALAWESYEIICDLVSHSPWNGWADTVSDICNGAVGALSAYYFLKK